MKIKSILSLLIVIILSLVLRLIILDKIPTGISDDELDYIVNAKSIFITGKDISGIWNPLSLTTPPLEYPKAELPYIIISPLIGLMNFSLFAARFPFALFNTALVAVLYFIAKRIFGKQQAVIIGFLSAINPWMIFFARTAFEAPVAILFYMTAFLIVIYSKGWRILFAFPILLIAFYTYIGTKIIFIPFVICISLFSWLFINNKKYTKQYISLFLLSIGLFFFYFVNQTLHNNSRLSEVFTPFNSQVAEEFISQRKLSLNNPFMGIASNKITVFLRQSTEKYLNTFSPQLLFLYGDGRSTFSIRQHGLFYFVDLFFLIMGIYGLYRKNKRLWVMLISLVLIAPLPSVLSNVGTTYPTRSALLFPLLIMLTGYGIWYTLYSKKFFSFKLFVVLIYILSLSNFLYIYVFRNPIYNSEGFGFSGRILTKYISLAENNKHKVVLLSDTSGVVPSLFKQYLFYTNNYNKSSAQEISELIQENDYSFRNLTITPCPQNFSQKSIYISVPDSKCKKIENNLEYTTIPLLSDGGTIYKIFNDLVCTKYKLKRYPENLVLSDFDIDNLSEEGFCTRYITKLD